MGASLRAKIMSGVLALLVLFAGALAVTLVLIEDSSMELQGIEEYHLVLNKMTNDLDVHTFELEIIAYELNTSPPPTREHAQKRQARAQEILQIVDRIFTGAIPLMEKGSEDPRNDLADRLTMAKLIGSLRALETGTRAFMDTAMRGINGAVEGKGAEARRAMSEMENFQDLDPVFTEIREKTAELTALSLQETGQNIQNVIRANLILFATAGVLGLLVFMIITGRLQAALS